MTRRVKQLTWLLKQLIRSWEIINDDYRENSKNGNEIIEWMCEHHEDVAFNAKLLRTNNKIGRQ